MMKLIIRFLPFILAGAFWVIGRIFLGELIEWATYMLIGSGVLLGSAIKYMLEGDD